MVASSEDLDEACFRAVLGRVAILELLVLAGMSLTWLGVGLSTPALFIGLSLARVPVWLLALYRLTQPVSAWEQAGQRRDDALARATDEALERLPDQFTSIYSLTWLVALALGLLLGLTGIAAHAPSLGSTELLAALLFLAALLLPLQVLLASQLRNMLRDTRTELCSFLLGRGLQPVRSPRSIDTASVRFTTASVLATIFGMAGFGAMWSAEHIRGAAVTEAHHLVELGVLRLTDGDELPGGVELVERAAVPASLADALVDSTSPSVAYYDVKRGRAVAFAPLDDGRALTIELDPDEQLDVFIVITLLLATLVVPSVWYAARINARAVSRPLEQFHAALSSFTERGELRALERVVPLDDDEIGRLARQFNAMLDVLEELVGAAEAVAGGDLRATLARPGELHDAFRGMLERLGRTVAELRETSLELASAAAEIQGLTRRQEEATQEQASTVEQVTASVGSLSAAARSIAGTAKGVLADAERAVATTDQMVARIGALRDQTTSIGELLDAIRQIADRSDLLALNGSLEAVRAGEVGRGFALVAAEMRRLAEQVAGILDDVREQVATIEATGARTVAATEDSRALAQRTADAARMISELTLQQSEETGQVSQGIEQVASMVASTALATSQTRAAAEGLRTQAQRLEELLRTFADS